MFDGVFASYKARTAEVEVRLSGAAKLLSGAFSLTRRAFLSSHFSAKSVMGGYRLLLGFQIILAFLLHLCAGWLVVDLVDDYLELAVKRWA